MQKKEEPNVYYARTLRKEYVLAAAASSEQRQRSNPRLAQRTFGMTTETKITLAPELMNELMIRLDCQLTPVYIFVQIHNFKMKDPDMEDPGGLLYTNQITISHPPLDQLSYTLWIRRHWTDEWHILEA